MTTSAAQFMELRDEFNKREVRLIGLKKEEYATDDDRILNFRQIAAFEGRTISQTTTTCFLKHIESITRAVQNDDFSKWCWVTPEGSEGLKQRFADARLYLLLLAACIEESVEELRAAKALS